MSRRPVWLRPAAERDIVRIADWYHARGGDLLERRFIAAVIAVRELIADNPDSGSPVHAGLLPGLPVPLRFHRLQGFESYLVYHLAVPEQVEILRVWNSRRGLEALFDEEGARP